MLLSAHADADLRGEPVTPWRLQLHHSLMAAMQDNPDARIDTPERDHARVSAHAYQREQCITQYIAYKGLLVVYVYV